MKNTMLAKSRKTKQKKAPTFKKNPSAPSIKPEDKVCLAMLEYIQLKHPDLYKTALKIHNEGERSYWTNRLLQKLGFRTGASDYFFTYPHNGKHGLFIEVKRNGWKITPSQKEHVERQKKFIEDMKAHGYSAYFCVGIDECIKAVDEYMS